MLVAAAVASSTSDAFICTTVSIWVIALLICSMPELCSLLADAISIMISATFFTEPTSSSIVLPACSTSLEPASTRLTEVLDEGADLLGRFGRALREAAHFGGHDREAAALLAGARGFDGGIEREDVGLERDAVDHADDVADAARGIGDFLERAHDLGNDLAALLRRGRCGARELRLRHARCRRSASRWS